MCENKSGANCGGRTRRRYLQAVVATGLTGAIAGCTDFLGRDGSRYDVEGWPMQSRDPGNTASAPDASGPRGDLEPRYLYSLTDDDEEIDPDGVYSIEWSSPVVTDGRVYVHVRGLLDDLVTYVDRLIAVDFGTGDRVWDVRRETRAGATTPIVADGTVVHGTYGTPGYDAGTGSERWRYAGNGTEGVVTYHDGTGFVANSDGLQTFDVADGSTDHWSDIEQYNHVLPAVDGDAVVLPEGNSLVAYDRETGEERWRTEYSFSWTESSEDGWGVLGTPVLGDNTAYVAADARSIDLGDGELAAFDRADGSRRWTFDGGETDEQVGVYGSLALADGTLYAAGGEGEKRYLYALDAATGDQKWRAENEAEIYYPTVCENTVYVLQYATDGDGVVAFDREEGDRVGYVEWGVDEYGGLDSRGPPPVVDGTLFVSTWDGVVGIGE